MKLKYFTTSFSQLLEFFQSCFPLGFFRHPPGKLNVIRHNLWQFRLECEVWGGLTFPGLFPSRAPPCSAAEPVCSVQPHRPSSLRTLASYHPSLNIYTQGSSGENYIFKNILLNPSLNMFHFNTKPVEEE